MAVRIVGRVSARHPYDAVVAGRRLEALRRTLPEGSCEISRDSSGTVLVHASDPDEPHFGELAAGLSRMVRQDLPRSAGVWMVIRSPQRQLEVVNDAGQPGRRHEIGALLAELERARRD